MSKKGKNKFKKIQRAKVIQESINQEEVVGDESPVKVGSENIMATVVSSKKMKNTPVVKTDEFLPQVSFVKRELRKISLIFGIIIVLIVAITIIDSKTNIVLNMADKIIKLF